MICFLHDKKVNHHIKQGGGMFLKLWKTNQISEGIPNKIFGVQSD